ncbi:hypothetical protein KEM48_010830 [Puccinia striiformis f. sp. tritici PST-130]|nr:hypothetical protein H4Q26_011559 [Puccinia striiformis f. sp. tritici PST-130]KAI9625568.1 hypothetical protein KEM48_010830 [Puccinia striiformis f. sp. tritici PST-130]
MSLYLSRELGRLPGECEGGVPISRRFRSRTTQTLQVHWNNRTLQLLHKTDNIVVGNCPIETVCPSNPHLHMQS